MVLVRDVPVQRSFAFSSPRNREGDEFGASEGGSSPVDFVLVGALLTALTLAVMQFALVVYVRNVVHDAAIEGAHRAALADATLADGVVRTRDMITRTIGSSFAQQIEASTSLSLGVPTVEMQVTTTFPLVGLMGPAQTLTATGRAPLEVFADE